MDSFIVYTLICEKLFLRFEMFFFVQFLWKFVKFYLFYILIYIYIYIYFFFFFFFFIIVLCWAKIGQENNTPHSVFGVLNDSTSYNFFQCLYSLCYWNEPAWSRIDAGVVTVTPQNFSQHQSSALWLHSLTASSLTAAPARSVLSCGHPADGEGCWEGSVAARVRKYYRHLLCVLSHSSYISASERLLAGPQKSLWRSGLVKPIMRPCCQIELLCCELLRAGITTPGAISKFVLAALPARTNYIADKSSDGSRGMLPHALWRLISNYLKYSRSDGYLDLYELATIRTGHRLFLF